MIACAVLVGRLGYMQLVRGELYSAQSRDNFMRKVRLEPDRGLIRDAKRRIIAHNRPSYTVTVTPHFVDRGDGEVLERVIRYVGLEGEQAQYEGLVQARAEQEVGDTATELLLDIVEGAVDRALSQVAVAGTSGRALSAGGAAIPIDACVTAALFDDDGGHIDAGARFTAEAVEDLPGGAGVLVTEGAAPDTRGEDPFVYTVDDDLVNALLYDAWAAGEPLAPEGEAGGAITSDLPPVLMIGEAAEGEPPEMFLAVGEVIIGVPTEGGEATTAVSAMIPAEAAADGQVLFLGPAVDAEVAQMDMTVEVLDAPEGADHDAIVAGAEDRFAAEVVAGMAEQPVEFELPEMPIDNFGSPELDGGTLGMAPPQSEPVAAGEGGDHIMVGAPADFSAPPEAEAD